MLIYLFWVVVALFLGVPAVFCILVTLGFIVVALGFAFARQLGQGAREWHEEQRQLTAGISDYAWDRTDGRGNAWREANSTDG